MNMSELLMLLIGGNASMLSYSKPLWISVAKIYNATLRFQATVSSPLVYREICYPPGIKLAG